MTQKEQALLTAALNRYGGRNQIVKAMEELAEAIRALSRVYQESDETDSTELILGRMNLAEELADVGIMTDQMKLLLPDVDYMTRLYRKAKMNRLEKRLSDEGGGAACGREDHAHGAERRRSMGL